MGRAVATPRCAGQSGKTHRPMYMQYIGHRKRHFRWVPTWRCPRCGDLIFRFSGRQ